MKKLLWLLVMLMLLTVTASADSIHMPDSLVSIQTEAFMGDTSITEVILPTGTLTIGDRAFMNCENLATAVLPDTVTTIGEQAFANCGNLSEEIYIPDSVTEIGADAFPYGTVLCGKPGGYVEQYVQQYATNNGYIFRSVQHYMIGEIYAGFDYVDVTMSCKEDCILRVDILDDYQEEVLLTGLTACEAGKTEECVTVYFVEDLPEFFALRAVLEDAEGNALCVPVLWLERMPEDPYQEFNAKTPGDFASGTVLNYNDDGFAVLRDDVRVVTGTENEGLFTVTADSEIYDGDCLYLSNINALVMAREVTDNGDGSYTMRSDDNAALFNFYQYINCHGVLDAVGDQQESPQLLASGNQGSTDLARITKEFSLGNVTAGITAGTSVSYDIRYDYELFGPSFLSCDVWAETDASISVAASREYTLKKEWLVYSRNQPTEVPGLLITTDQYLILDLAAKAEASATAAINGRVGFRYDTDNGFRPIRNCEAGWDLSAGAEASCKVGPKIAVGISFLRLLSAEFSGEAGCEMKAETKLIDAHSNDEVQDRKHACTLCFDLNVSAFTSVDTSIKSLGIHLDDHNLYENEKNIFEGYLSVLNEDESVLHGKPTINKGECPNYKYRTSIEVQDPDAAPGEQKIVSLYRIVNRVERTLITERAAPFTVYLYPGDYLIETDHLDMREKMNFTVEDEAFDLLMDFTLIPVDEDHFPDAVFRNLVSDFDLDKDGYLSSWERSRVNTIYFNWWENMDLMESMQGIAFFHALKTLEISFPEFQELDLSNNTQLREIDLEGVIQNQLNISGCSDLRKITLSTVGEVDVSHNPLLEEFVISGVWVDHPSTFTQLDLSNHPHLERVGLQGCQYLTSLNVSNNPALKYLSVQTGRILNPDGSSPTNNPGQLTSLDVRNLSALEMLRVHCDNLTSIKMNGCSSLSFLEVETASMTTFSLTMLPAISDIIITNLRPARLTVDVTHKNGLSGHGTHVRNYHIVGNVIVYFADGSYDDGFRSYD